MLYCEVQSSVKRQILYRGVNKPVISPWSNPAGFSVFVPCREKREIISYITKISKVHSYYQQEHFTSGVKNATAIIFVPILLLLFLFFNLFCYHHIHCLLQHCWFIFYSLFIYLLWFYIILLYSFCVLEVVCLHEKKNTMFCNALCFLVKIS